MVVQQLISEEEYLRAERNAIEKSEYYQGELYPMAGATKEHNRIKENIATEIGYFLKRKPCQSFSGDFRVHIPKNSLYAYPDVVIVCGELMLLNEEFDTLLNPTALVEVLSKSTRGYDQYGKFELYRDIASLTEYITIDSRRIKASIWNKSATGIWSLVQETSLITDTLLLRSIDLPLSMQDVYDRVEGLTLHG